MRTRFGGVPARGWLTKRSGLRARARGRLSGLRISRNWRVHASIFPWAFSDEFYGTAMLLITGVYCVMGGI
jgi:hypothetical protein